MENLKQLESRRGVTSFPCYHDFSRKDHEWVEKRFNQIQNQPHRGTKANFPQCLFYMLESLERAGCCNIVGFQPHGRSFKIHDRKLFADEILPQYFQNQTKIASFLRQLNIYGFLRKIKPGPDQDTYYHPFFLRGRPDLCRLIPRKSTALCSARQTYDPLTEPDFYKMLPVTDPNQCPAQGTIADTGVINDESNRSISAMTPDRQQCIGDGGSTINLNMSAEEVQKIAPINHVGHEDMNVTSFIITFHRSCASTTDQDSINYPLLHELCSIQEMNPIIQTYSRQGCHQITEIDHSRSSQPFDTTLPDKLFNDATLNYYRMTGNYCNEIRKVQSFLSMSNQTISCCGNMHNIEPIQGMNTFPLTDTFRVGTMFDRNTVNGAPSERSNATVVSSLRMFGADFVNPQQQHAPQTDGNRNSHTCNDPDKSFRTSGLTHPGNTGNEHWDTKTISSVDTFSRRSISAADRNSPNYSFQSNPITHDFSREGYNQFTEIDDHGIPKSMEAIVSRKLLDDERLNFSGFPSSYRLQPTCGNMDDVEPTQCMRALPSKDTSRLVTKYDQNTLHGSPKHKSKTTERLSLRMFAANFVHEQQQLLTDQTGGNNRTVLSNQDDDASTYTSGSDMVRFLEDVDLESDNE